MDDEAVSPVIGVILMVAITVVLAAVLFVLVSGYGSENQVVQFPAMHVGAAAAPTDAIDAALATLDHRAGECIDLSEYVFEALFDGQIVRLVHDDADGLLCVGESVNLGEGPAGGIDASMAGRFVDLRAIRGTASAIVYDEPLRLAE